MRAPIRSILIKRLRIKTIVEHDILCVYCIPGRQMAYEFLKTVSLLVFLKIQINQIKVAPKNSSL